MWWRTALCLGLCSGLGVVAALSQASRQTPIFEARARLSVPYESIQGVDRAVLPIDGGPGQSAAQLSGSTLAAWSDRVKARQLATPSPAAFESELDALRRPLRIDVEKQAGGDEFELIYQASDPELARRLLEAAVECCLDEYRSLRKGAASTATASVAVHVEQLRQRAAAIEANRSEAQARLAQLPVTEATRPAIQERARLLAAAQAEAKQRRLESENRFTQVRSDLAEGVPADLIISRLPDGPLRSALENSLERKQRERELTRLRGLVRERSKIWGAEHPRLRELQRQVAELETSVNDRVVQVSTTAATDSLPLPDLLLKLLAGDLAERQNNERDLAEQLAAEESLLSEYDQQVAAITELDHALASARAEEAAARGEFTAREREWEAIGVTVASAATAAEEPVSWSATDWIALGLGGGAGSGLLLASVIGAVWTRPARTTARSLGRPLPGSRPDPQAMASRSTGEASPVSPTSRAATRTLPARSTHGDEVGTDSRRPLAARESYRTSPDPLGEPLRSELPEGIAAPVETVVAAAAAFVPARTPPAPVPAVLTDSAARLARLQQLQVGSEWHPAQMPPT